MVSSCTNDEIIEANESTNSSIYKDHLINFKGLPVNHRFKTPKKELFTEHNEDKLKTMFAKAKTEAYKKKGVTYKSDNVNLPDPETIVKGVDMIIDLFPFNNTQQEKIANRHLLDSLQIAKIEEEFQIKQQKEFEENWEMIKNDFPTLTEKEIVENLDLIDEYYTQNLNYLTMDIIANKEEEILNKINISNNLQQKNNSGDISDGLSCLISNIALAGGFNIIQVNYAAKKAKEEAEFTIKHFFTSANGVPITGGNSVNNTYKHMVFSAFLAQWYFTVSSKSKRLDFARVAGNRHELCNPNEDDGREMDYHNNSIGRDIWDTNTTYRKLFGTTVALNRPSDSKLREEIRKRISNSSCFIVKENGDQFPENLQKKDLTKDQVKSKILATPSHIPVYFTGPILESKYVLKRVKVGTESYDCSGDNSNGGDDEGDLEDLTPTTMQCTRPVYNWINTEIKPCYKL